MSNKRYIIKIEEHAIETVVRGKEWKPVNNIDGVDYAYTPEIEKQEKVTRQIYVQNTDNLDLTAVIKAVNGF